ncbi:hypothetical protein [Spirosoma pomorum]
MPSILTVTRWAKGYPNGLRQIVATPEPGLSLISARQWYASEHDLTLLAGVPSDRVTLYWDRNNRLVRLAFEETSTPYPVVQGRKETN